MRTLTILTLLLATTTALAQEIRGPIQTPDGPTTYYLSSDYIEGECRVRILKPDNPTNRILFILPVTPWPGFDDKWERLGSGLDEIIKHDHHNTHGYTVVAPDFPQHMPWFVDHATDPKRRHESYMTQVLIPFVDATLDLEDPVRHLVGFSKSGFGSLSLLLRQPNLFHAASVWDVGGINRTFEPENTNSLANATGAAEHYRHYQLHESLSTNADHFRSHPRIAISGYSNDAFRARLHALRDVLEQEEVAFLYDESSQVPHRWYTSWLSHSLVQTGKIADGLVRRHG